MEMSEVHQLAVTIVEHSVLLFTFLLGVGVLTLIVMYLVDITQTSQTIRRNYPVVGRFRYLFEHLGEFFRQYFFAMDREELHFNRAERSSVSDLLDMIERVRRVSGKPTGITTHNKDLQKSLVPEDKCKRVAAYAKRVAYGVGMIAHSCGVPEPRGLQRQHMRVIESSDKSHGMLDLDPIPPVREEYSRGLTSDTGAAQQ